MPLGSLSLAPQAVGQQRPQLVQGTVSTAPAGWNEPLQVTIDGWRQDRYWTIDDWPSDHGATLPSVGDLCLLAVDIQRKLWLVRWQGTHS